MAATKTTKTAARARAAKTPPSALPASDITQLLTGRAEALDIAPEALIASPLNRRHIDGEDPENLAFLDTIRAAGICDRLDVRPHPQHEGHYEILSGHLRHWAAYALDLPTVPCLVHHDVDDDRAGDLVAVMNFHRHALPPFEDAATVQDCLDRHGNDTAAVAAILGRPQHWVVARARLGTLSPEWRAAWADPENRAHEYSIRHMEIIARLDAAGQARCLEEWAGPEDTFYDSVLSTRDLQIWIHTELLHRMADAPFSREDATLAPDAGACVGCITRTACAGKLWVEDDTDDPEADDHCTDPDCWDRKTSAWLHQRADLLARKHGPDLVLISHAWHQSLATEALVEEFGAPVLCHEKYTVGKKTSIGAVPALVVDGHQKGEQIWITPFTTRADAHTGRARASGATVDPTPLSERREMLDKKRWFETLRLARAALGKIAIIDLPSSQRGTVPLIQLAAAFGTNHRNNMPGTFLHHNDAIRDEIDPWALLVKWQSDYSPVPDAQYELWQSVRAVLRNRIHYGGPITQTPDESIEDCKKIAALVGLDLDALRAQAAVVYKEPKSWKKLSEE